MAQDSSERRSLIFELIEKTYNDPALFFRAALGVKTLRTWQKRACARIREQLVSGNLHVEVLIRTCHGAGKTFFAAGLLLWYTTTRYRARGLSTAPTWKGVEELLWSEVAKLYNRSLMRASGFGRLLSTSLQYDDGWFALGVASDRPENLEGYHSENAAIRIVDEAKAVGEETFTATEGLLTAPASFDLWISTPSIETGPFYERDMGPKTSVIRECVSIDDLIADPEIDEKTREGFVSWKATAAEEWGVESAEFQSRAMGRYIDNAEGALFPSSWIERATGQSFPCFDSSGTLQPGWRIVHGMDVAGSVDGDENAVATVAAHVDSGSLEVLRLSHWHERDTMVSKGRAIAIRNYGGVPPGPVRVDAIGIGKGVLDALRADGIPAEEYRSSETPKDRDRFANRKAEDAWALRGMLEKSRVGMGRLDPKDQQAVKSQMRATRYEILRTGKLRVIDPDDSPDLSDAVVIASAARRIGITSMPMPEGF